MTIIVLVVLYIIIAGGSMPYFERLFGETVADSPAPFFSGIFWPFAAPIMIPYRLVKAHFRRVDQVAETKRKEDEETKRRLRDLERELEKEAP